MKPNGGKSHFTPISQRLRALTSAGSGGSFAGFGLAAGACACGLSLLATPAAASAAATIAIAVAIATNLLMYPLLRRWSTPPASLRAEASGVGTFASAL